MISNKEEIKFNEKITPGTDIKKKIYAFLCVYANVNMFTKDTHTQKKTGTLIYLCAACGKL